jgi:CheY-like chemotaxis protein
LLSRADPKIFILGDDVSRCPDEFRLRCPTRARETGTLATDRNSRDKLFRRTNCLVPALFAVRISFPSDMFRQVQTGNKQGVNCEPYWQEPTSPCSIVYLMQSNLESDFRRQIASERPQTLTEVRNSRAAPRILIADDQEDMLRTITLALADEFEIIGTAEDGKSAVELATRLLPDVLVLDISMPIMNGIEAAWRLKRLGSTIRVVFLTVYTDPDFVEAARCTGALGYVRKECLAKDLAPTIRAVMRGGTFIPPFGHSY